MKLKQNENKGESDIRSRFFSCSLLISCFVLFSFALEEPLYAFGSWKSAKLSETKAPNESSSIATGGGYVSQVNMSLPICGCSSCIKTSGFGYRRRPRRRASSGHWAIDIGAPTGTPVLAMEAGKLSVRSNSRTKGYGKQLSVVHNKTYESRYAHLNKFVKTSGFVKRGELIGYSGQTGVSTGPHIHLEVLKNGRKINPEGMVSGVGKASVLRANKCSGSSGGSGKTKTNTDFRGGSIR